METITLNDGTVVNGHILEDGYGQMIFVYLDGMNLMQGFMLMSDSAKTSVMTAENHGVEHVYNGFTEIISINSEFGNCNLTMRKPVQQIQATEPEVVTE